MRSTVVHYLDSRDAGGAARVVLSWLADADRERWRPVLVHPAAVGLAPVLHEARRLGVATRPVPIPRHVFDLAPFVALARACREEGADVLHAHLSRSLAGGHAVAAARRVGVPTVLATAHRRLELRSRPGNRLRARTLAAGLDRLLAVSEAIARQWRDVVGVPAAKVRCITNGIDFETFECAPDPALRGELAGTRGRAVVLCVARLEPRKGQRQLVDAAVELPDAVFVFVGDGPDRAALEKRASDRGVADRVRFLGVRCDVPALLAACDVFALPAPADGFPLSLLEAMAAARPVVATAIAGTDEVVADGTTGRLVPPGDASALAAAIRDLLTQPERARALGEAGRARAREHYGAQRMVRETSAAYEDLLASAGTGG